MTSSGERADFAHIRAIPNRLFIILLLDNVQSQKGRSIAPGECTVVARREGSYHHVVCINLPRNGQIERYVFRVPAHGTKAFWGDEDRYMMRREVELLRYLREKTNVPVPKVIGFYTELGDTLDAPWMLQEMLPGTSAMAIWFDQPYDGSTAYLGADNPTPETYRKRLKLLESLANHMTRIGNITFPFIGIPEITHRYGMHSASTTAVTVGPSYHWNDADDIHKVVKRGPFKSTRDYIYAAFDRLFDLDSPKNNDRMRETKYRMLVGSRKVLEFVYSTSPFTMEDEAFTIHHTDLDLQNILTDEEGNVTGIIDWDGAFAAPRCIGTAAAPKFLLKDLYVGENGERLEGVPHMAWNTAYYRNLYAAAVQKAELEQGVVIGAKYTSKSALYHQVFSSLYEGGDAVDLVEKILGRIPEISQHPLDFLILLGQPGGFPEAEKMLKKAITKMFEPELPAQVFVQELVGAPPGKSPSEHNSIDADLQGFHIEAPSPKRTQQITMSPQMVEAFVQTLVAKNIIKFQPEPSSSPRHEQQSDSFSGTLSPPSFVLDLKSSQSIKLNMEVDDSGNAITALGFDVINI